MDAALLPRVDITMLIHNMGGNDEVIGTLFALFWQTCASCSGRMETALREKSYTVWEATAHELKGAALSVTARRIAGLCEEAEHMHTLDRKEGAALLYHLNKEIAILHKEVAKLGW